MTNEGEGKNRLVNVGIADLVKITIKSVDPDLQGPMVNKVRETVNSAPSDPEDITKAIDALAGYAPLNDTINSVRAAVTTKQTLMILCNSILVCLRETGEMPQIKGVDPNAQTKGAGGNYNRRASKDEDAVWDIIHGSG